MKGHVKIELFDHKTGKRKTTERHNMLTNALAYRAGIDSNDTMNLYSSEYSLLPLGTKGLGGLFLFDGPLTEDAGNIHFPMDVHLTGCAGRGTGSPASNLQGTIDSTASGFIDGKFVSVWNFLPNQANGVIASLALTHARAGATPFHMYRANAWNTISNSYRHFVAMDLEKDTAYFSYNYQATSTISFYKRKLSRHLLRVNTPYLGAEETALNFSLSSEPITDRSYWDVTPDYDGYIYLLATQGNQTGNATVHLRRLKASADHFSLEQEACRAFPAKKEIKATQARMERLARQEQPVLKVIKETRVIPARRVILEHRVPRVSVVNVGCKAPKATREKKASPVSEGRRESRAKPDRKAPAAIKATRVIPVLPVRRESVVKRDQQARRVPKARKATRENPVNAVHRAFRGQRVLKAPVVIKATRGNPAKEAHRAYGVKRVPRVRRDRKENVESRAYPVNAAPRESRVK